MSKIGWKENRSVYTFLRPEERTKNKTRWKENVVAYTFLGPALLLFIDVPCYLRLLCQSIIRLRITIY